VRFARDERRSLSVRRLSVAVSPIADLARRRLVVVERQGQAHIIRICTVRTSLAKSDEIMQNGGSVRVLRDVPCHSA